MARASFFIVDANMMADGQGVCFPKGTSHPFYQKAPDIAIIIRKKS